MPCVTMLREKGFRAALLERDKAGPWITQHKPDAIIISGGDGSVYESDAPQVPPEVLTAVRKDGRPTPVLWICYGHQWVAQHFGGTVVNYPRLAEHGESIIETVGNPTLFRFLPPEQIAFTSHGDTVTKIPDNFFVTARSGRTGAIAAMQSNDGRFHSVQFHPDSRQTHYGPDILENFVKYTGECIQDWSPSSLITSIAKEIREASGGRKVLEAYSGGIDSTVVGCIGAKELGNRLLGVTIDIDNLREGEVAEIEQNALAGHIPHKVVNAHEDVALFGDVLDAQKKRVIFAIDIYEKRLKAEAAAFGAELFIDGTLAPDLIESGNTGSATIKKHHNALANIGLPTLQPLRDLFKHEVRALAEELGLAKHIAMRKPFPGPGLPLRLVDLPVTHKNLALLRWSDYETDKILQKDKRFYDEASQIIVALLGFRSTGVKGDGPVYDISAAVRVVKTIDYINAKGLYPPQELMDEIIATLTSNRRIVRVLLDATTKPPGTIEYQ